MRGRRLGVGVMSLDALGVVGLVSGCLWDGWG